MIYKEEYRKTFSPYFAEPCNRSWRRQENQTHHLYSTKQKKALPNRMQHGTGCAYF